LQDLIGRYLKILKTFCRADAARLQLFNAGDRPPPRVAPGLIRPRFLDGASGRKWILDAGLRRRYRSFWSIPLLREGHLAGVMQFGFAVQYRWLPRELHLLCAAAERCLRAAERVKLMADLAGREEQVRCLGEHMMRIEEEERRRISRELHDETGQSLLCIRLQLELLERTSPDGLRARVVEIRELTEHTIIEIRRIIAALSPTVLEQLGLAAALRQLTNRFRSLYPGQVRLQISTSLPRLSRETETTAYRLVQECYHNVAKHSQAPTVNTSLRSTDELLRLSVHDDGVGFETGTAPGRNSTGLTGMKERVALLGGRFEIRSRLHHGTTIRADLPLGTIPARPVKSAGRTALKRKQDVI
jgi:signal transduction histidine kinase